MSDIGDELLLENAEADLKRGLGFRETREQERRMQAIAQRAGLASFAAPGMTQLSPELQVALSEDPNMSDLDIIEMMSGVEGALSLDSYSGNLVAQMSVARNDAERFDIWQQVPAEIQAQLQNDPEFVAPQPPPESGIWGTNLIRRLGGMITPGSDWGAGDRGNDFGKGSAAGDISQDIASGIAKPFKFAGAKVMDAFDLIDYPATQVQRAIRTAEHLNIPLTPQDALSASRNALSNRDEFLESPSERERIDRVMSADSPWQALKQMATEMKASWDETEEAGFSLGAMDRTRNAFAGDEFKIEAAKMLASGKDIMTVAAEMSGAEQGTPEFAEVFAVVWDMQGDEQIVEVVSDLSRNRMSAGGAIVEATTPIDRHSTLGQISGTMAELGIYMVVDPTIVGSKINSIRKLARHGVNTGRMNSELYRLHELAKLAREADEGTDIAQLADRIAEADNLSEATFRETRIAKAIMSDPKRLEAGRRVDRVFEKVVRMYDKTDTAYNESQLLEEFPHMASLIPALNKIDGSTGINKIDDVWDAVRTNQATRTMLNTSSAGRDPRIFQLPHLSKTGQKWLETKATWNDAIRWGDGSASAYDEAVTELSRQFRASELDSEAYRKQRQVLSASRWGDDIGKVAKMRKQAVDSMRQTAHALTTHVPRKNNVLSVAADGESAEDLANNAAALNDFKRLTGFGRKLGLPRQVADEYVDLFARGTTGDRHVLVRTFTAELLAESGNMSPEMAKLWDDYVELGNRIYSGGTMVPDQAWTVQNMIDQSATFAGELSKQVSIPSFDEITKAKWRTDTTRQIAGVPTDYLDVMMNRVWKPLVLMRVGFIARAAGEETISFMLRLGPTTLAKSYLSKTAVGMRKHAITGELVDASELGAIENTVNGLAYKMAGWAKVSNDDVMKMSADLIDDPSELSRLQGLLDDRIRVGDDMNAQKYQTQINEIIDAAETKYLDEKRKGFWSRQVMDMHEWAQAKAMEQSPGWFTFNRNSVIGGKIPTKAELSRMMLGVDRNIDPHRLGRIHMGNQRKFRHADGQEYSSAERLIAAHYAIMTQPSTARLLAKDVAATIGPAYMARRDDSRTFSRSLSQTDEYETSIVDGKLRTVRVRPLTGQWEFLNDDSPRMKQALGDAVARIGADPVMNQSGVMEMASSHVGSNTLKEITEKLGDDALDQINLVRRRLSEIRFEPETQVLRELLAGTATPTKEQIEAVAKGDITMRNVITEVANNRRLRGKLFPIEDPTDLRAANFADLEAEMLDTLGTYSRRVDYQPTQEQLAKASTVLKMPIIAPTPPGMVNLYSPMLDTRMVGALSEMVSTNPGTAEAIIEEALFSLQKAGYPAEDLDGLGKELLQQLERLSPGSDGMTNFLRVSFTDPRHAGIVAKSVEDRLQGDAQFRALMDKVPFKTQDSSTGVGKLTLDAKDLDNPVLSAKRMDDSESTFLTPTGQFEVLDPQRTGIYIEIEDGRMVDQSEYYRSREHYVDAVEVDSTAESVAAARARANAVFQKRPDIPTTSAEEMRAINNRNVVRAEVEDLREAVEFNRGTARGDELAEQLERAEKRLESANQHIRETKIMAATKQQGRSEVLRVERVDPPELENAKAEVARIKKLKAGDDLTADQKLDMLDEAQANVKALQAQADEAYRAQVAAAEQSVQAVDRPVYLSELDELMASRPIGADEIAKREIKSLKDRREKLRAELMEEQLRKARKAKRNRLSKKEERTVARRVGQHPDMKELNAEIRAVDSTEFAKESAEKLEAWHRKVEKAREKARLDEASFAEWEKEYAEYQKLIEIAEQGTTRTEYMLRFNEPLQPTGNVEWVNGATNEMALRALNEARVKDFMDVVTAGGIDVTGASDEILSEVIDPILRGVFDSKFHPHLVPNVELKPQWAPVIDRQLSGKGDMFNRLVQGWFQGVVDPMMSRIIRTPHYAVNMASSMPFAEDLYYMRAAMFQAEVPPISDDVLDSIHALWRTDETELLDSGDEVAEAIVSLRNKTLHEEPRLQKALGLKNVDEGTAKVLSAWANNRAQAYAEAIESASIRAVDLTVEFIDDHRFRSQFQQTVRQVIPFWFAEEQFLKRQVRMLAQSPDAIRKAALFMDGMRHTGMVTTDAQGNEIFVYPGTEAVNRFVLYNTGLVFGFESMEAFAQPMTANVDFMFPGMKPTELASNPFSMVMPAPNPSPVVGVPLAAMTDRFPELGFIEQQLLGNRAGQDPMTQLVPSTVARLFGVLGVGAFGADRLASAQMRAMQALDIAGLDPGPDASTFEKQAYADRVRSYARVLNIMDATMYATAPLPAGAGVEFKDLEISKEFSQIMFESGLERNEAFAMFVERYPDYGVWQVYSSDNVTGAAIPQTEAGLQFLLDNEELLTNNPHGAAWLAPPFESDDEDVWSRRAHDQLYAAGLRADLAPEEYLEEIYIREALPAYYDMIETAEREIFIAAQQGDDQLADMLEEQLRIDKETYKRTHPVFADSLDDNLGRNKARKDQRDAILAMPREALPDGGHVDQVLNLMSSFAQFEREISALSDTHTKAADDQRVQLRNSFYAWANEYVKENPGARTYWQNVVQHDRIIGGYVTEFTYEYGSG